MCLDATLVPLLLLTRLTSQSVPGLTACCQNAVWHNVPSIPVRLQWLSAELHFCDSIPLAHPNPCNLPDPCAPPPHTPNSVPPHPHLHFAEAPPLVLCPLHAEMILESVGKCDVDVRRDLYSGIILTGDIQYLKGRCRAWDLVC